MNLENLEGTSSAQVSVTLPHLVVWRWLACIRLLHNYLDLFAISKFKVTISLAVLLNQVAAFLYYDHLITIGNEISYIWSRRKTASAYWFFLNRYLSFFGNIVVTAFVWYPLSLEVRTNINHSLIFAFLYFLFTEVSSGSSSAESWLIVYSPQLQTLQPISANVAYNKSNPCWWWAINRNRRVSLTQPNLYEVLLSMRIYALYRGDRCIAISLFLIGIFLVGGAFVFASPW